MDCVFGGGSSCCADDSGDLFASALGLVRGGDGANRCDAGAGCVETGRERGRYIEIDRALHLDRSGEVVKDITAAAAELDGAWTDPVRDGETVRVTFEEDLVEGYDVTLYPRVVSGSPTVRVYHVDGDAPLAEFTSLTPDTYNRVYLTDLDGSHATFDLRVTNGTVAFDHIIDPDYDQLDDFNGYSGCTASPTYGNWTAQTGSSSNTQPWTANSGGTGSGGTGPGSGNPDPYLYIEASNGGTCDGGTVSAGESHYLESNAVDASTYALRFSFDWNMNLGTDQTDAELHVDAWNGASWDLDVTGSAINTGDNGDTWVSEDVDLSGYSNSDLKVRVRYVVGTGTNVYENDVAVDNLRIYGNVSSTTSLSNFTPSDGAVTDPDQNLSVDLSSGDLPANVSFYWGNGTLIETVTGVATNSTVEVDPGTLAVGSHSWYVNATDAADTTVTSATRNFTALKPYDVSATWDTAADWDSPTSENNVSHQKDAGTLSIFWNDQFDDGTIGSAWNTTDQDTVASTSFSESGGQLDITAGGADTWTGSDEYGSVYTSYDGNFTAVLKVDSQQNTDPWAKTGIMLRNDMTASGSSTGYAFMAVTPGNDFSFQYDSDGNGNLDTSNSVGVGSYPAWIKLEKSGNTVTGYYATTDPFSGGSWTQADSYTFSGADINTVQDVGVSTTSHAGTTLSTTLHDYFLINPGTSGTHTTAPKDLNYLTDLVQVTANASVPTGTSVNATVQFSTDNSSWTDAGTISLTDGNETYAVSGSGQYVRMHTELDTSNQSLTPRVFRYKVMAQINKEYPRLQNFMPTDGDTVLDNQNLSVDLNSSDFPVDVSFYWGNGSLIETVAGVSSNGTVEIDPGRMDYGSYTWYVNATDVDGNTSSSAVRSFTVDAIPGDPSITSNRYSSNVAPGYTVTYPLTVTNNDDETDTIWINTSIDDPSWPYSITNDSVTLAGGESTTVTLSLTVPSGAAIGSSANITVFANSSRDAKWETFRQTKYEDFIDDSSGFDEDSVPDHDGTMVTGSNGSTTTTLYSDGFEDGTFSPWTTSNSDRSGVSTQTSKTGTYSMYTRYNQVDVTSPATDLSGRTSATLKAWISDGASGVNDPENVESLTVQYLDSGGNWDVLEDISGSGDPGTTYDKEWGLPSDALHADFRVRFSQQGGSGQPYDYWFIDDVVVETTNTDGDGEVQLLTYSDAFTDNSLSNDWVVRNGSWSETGSQLQQDNDSVGAIYNRNATGGSHIFEGADDHNISVNMRTDDSAHWQSLMMRTDSNQVGIEVRLDYVNNKVEIAKYENDVRTQINSSTVTLNANTWYTVNASVDGDTVNAWVDGTHYLRETVTVNSSYNYVTHYVTLKGREDSSLSSVNYYDDLEVWALNGTFTSSDIDAGDVAPDYDTSSLYFNTSIPAGTNMTATVRASPDPFFEDGDDITQTFVLTDGNTTYATDWMDGYHHVRAEVTLVTDDKSTTPTLYDWGVTRNSGTPSDAVYIRTTAAAPEYNVTISASPTSEDIPPGGSFNFTLTVTNDGTIPDIYDLTANDTGDHQFFDQHLHPAETSKLDPGESETGVLEMIASSGVPYDSHVWATVTVESDTDTSVTANTTVSGHVLQKHPDKVRVVTNRYVVLDDPNNGNPQTGFDDPPEPWNSDYWNQDSTTIKAYAMVQSQYGEPMENETVNITIRDWAGTIRLGQDAQTNHAGIAEVELDTNDMDYWGVWTVNATAGNASAGYVTDTTTFVRNYWGCGDCHDNMGKTPANGGSYTRSHYIEGYEQSGHTDADKSDMGDYAAAERCVYCHKSYGGTDIAGDGSSGGQYPWGTHRNKKLCQDCHTPNSDGNWLRNGGDDGFGMPLMPSCFSGKCHNLVNPNVQPWRTTTMDLNKSQYSTIWVADAVVEGETVYSDDFEDGTLSPWTSTGAESVGVTTDTSQSGTYSLYLQNGGSQATCESHDLSAYSSGELRFWTDKGVNVDDIAEDLDVYYYQKDTSGWDTTYRWTKMGDVESHYSTPRTVTITIPRDGLHSQSRFRFEMQDDDGDNPRWYVDDVEIITGSQGIGQPSKAHSTYENGGDVPCIMCHGPMHNITTPYPAGQGNDVTEKEQCYQCHIDTKHAFYKGIPSPQPCIKCHTQDIHSIRGSLRMRPRPDSARYDNDRNLLYKDDPAWGVWQRWELAYNDTYNASSDVYRDETVQSGTCESCHVGTNQKRGVHRINLTYVAPIVGEYSYFGWNGKGLNCLGCHDSKLNGSGTGQEIHSAHPASYNGTRTRCGTCHAGGARKSGVGEVPQSATTTGTYTVTVFGINQTYDATEPQTCQQCHDDWHRNPTYDHDRFPTLSQGLNDTLQTNASTNNTAPSFFPGPRDPVFSTVSPGVIGVDNCTSAPCHLDAAHQAMRPAAFGSRFPQYQPSGSPGCASCHALNKWGSHPEALTDLYSNYQEDISFRSPCDTCHFEAQEDEGYMSNIYKPF